MAKNIPAKAGSKYGDLYRRLIFLVLALVVYRIGTHIPVPGIDPDTLKELFNQQQGGILGLFNMFSGGALSRFSVFALGIMPYISASIIMLMLSYVLPSLESLRRKASPAEERSRSTPVTVHCFSVCFRLSVLPWPWKHSRAWSLIRASSSAASV